MSNYGEKVKRLRRAMAIFLKENKGTEVVIQQVSDIFWFRTEKVGKHSKYGILKQKEHLETVWAYKKSAAGKTIYLARLTEKPNDGGYEFEDIDLKSVFGDGS